MQCKVFETAGKVAPVHELGRPLQGAMQKIDQFDHFGIPSQSPRLLEQALQGWVVWEKLIGHVKRMSLTH